VGAHNFGGAPPRGRQQTTPQRMLRHTPSPLRLRLFVVITQPPERGVSHSRGGTKTHSSASLTTTSQGIFSSPDETMSFHTLLYEGARRGFNKPAHASNSSCSIATDPSRGPQAHFHLRKACDVHVYSTGFQRALSVRG